MPRVVSLFKDKWPGGFLPLKLILRELRKAPPPISERALRYALAKAVRQGDLRVVRSNDGGALYVLASYAEANPAQMESIRSAPLRMLQRQGPEFDSKAVRRWRHADGLRGAHDYRPDHKCIPCGNRPCLFLTLQNPTMEEFEAVMREVANKGVVRRKTD